MKTAFASLALLALVLALPAEAQVAGGGNGLTFKAELVEKTRFRMKGKALTFEGKLNGYPNGTQIDIRFKIRENRQHIAWYKTRVTKDAIKGEQFYRPNKAGFMPAVYSVEFWFQMQTQTPGMRNWFRTNRGWTANYRELLDTVTIKLGDEEARAAALDTCYKKVAKMFAPAKDFGKAMRAHLDKIQKMSEAEKNQAYQEWMSKSDGLWRERLGALQTEEYYWAKKYVALPAEEGRLQMKTIVSQALSLLGVYKDRRPTVEASYKHLETSLRQLDDLLSADKEVDIGRSKSGGKSSGDGDSKDKEGKQ